MKILLLSLLFYFAASQCIHEKLDIPLEYLDQPDYLSTGTNFAASDFSNIRVHLDYTYVTNVTTELEAYIKGISVASANYFHSTLSVSPVTGRLTIPVQRVCGLNVPNSYISTGVEADLVIFVRTVYDNDTYIAAARPCMLISGTNRPAIGELIYNMKYIKISGTLDYQRNLLTAMHEITHILGFSSSLYDLFINPDTNRKLTGHVKYKIVNGVNTTYLDINPLTSIVREYFSCPDLEGAPLENEGRSGSKGSHWERKIFMNEFMTASDIIDSRISVITLGLLEGTGWYKANLSNADNYYWGKKKGCNFLRLPCVDRQTKKSNFEEFCSPISQQGCSYTGRAVGFCGSPRATTSPELPASMDYWGNQTIVYDTFADNCPYYIAYSNADCENSTHSKVAKLSDEYYGKGAKCFSGTIYKSGELSQQVGYCFKYSCERDSSGNYILKVELGTKTAICTQQEKISVTGYQGKLNCPDPSAYCTTIGVKYCPRGCMGNGVCKQDGTCSCKEDWGGDDCGIALKITPDVPVDDGSKTGNNANTNSPNYFAILIGVGLVVGIFAYMRYKNRREEEEDDNEVELLPYRRN